MVFLAQLNAPEPWQLTFQNPSTPVMEGIINFYYDLSFFIVFIAFFVSYLLGICIYLFKRNRTPSKVLHGTVIEIIWTITPALILIVIAIPSFSLLYSIDEIITDPFLTIKIVGHQWYWSYEYNLIQQSKKLVEHNPYLRVYLPGKGSHVKQYTNTANRIQHLALNEKNFPNLDKSWTMKEWLDRENLLLRPEMTYLLSQHVWRTGRWLPLPLPWAIYVPDKEYPTYDLSKLIKMNACNLTALEEKLIGQKKSALTISTDIRGRASVVLNQVPEGNVKLFKIPSRTKPEWYKLKPWEIYPEKWHWWHGRYHDMMGYTQVKVAERIAINKHIWNTTKTYKHNTLNFDSYMIDENDLSIKGSLRLLEVDNRLVIPIKKHIRLLITAADVLHCWAVPSFGVKLDACPGRLNQTSLYLLHSGTSYGQCSEICGINHGFMPIVVDGVDLKTFSNWFEKMKTTDAVIKSTKELL